MPWGSRKFTTTQRPCLASWSLWFGSSPVLPLGRTPAQSGRVPGTARQLGAEQVEQLIADYRAGATVYTLSSQLGIDRRTVGAPS